MNKDEEQVIGCLMTEILTFAAVPFIAALKGFTFSTMWRWFIAPQFGAPELSVLAAVGIFLTFDLLNQRWRKTDDDEDMLKETIKRIVYICIACVLTLAKGWIVLKLMGR